MTADLPAAPTATLIDRLLDDELATLRLQVAAGHRDQALKALDERGNAQELVRQQYSGRYAFELLQNANDAAIGCAGQAAVRFQVTDTSLVVANMGTAFGEDEVRAICSLGRSSKNPRKTVGYKGLGFKSVGEITSSPQVFSPPHCFGFDALQARRLVQADAGPLLPRQRLPVYAFPLPLESADAGGDSQLVHELLASGFVTVLRLPYRPGVTRSHVADAVTAMLRPELLLLLDATDRLELAGSGADFEAERLVESGDPFDEVVLSVDGNLQQWRVRRQRHEVPDPQMVAAIDGWAHVTAVSTTVAARHDGTGRLDAEPVRPLHVYFPLEDSAGTTLLLHGDFALDLDRRHISTAPEARQHNAWLADRLVAAAAEAAQLLAAAAPTDPALARALAPRAVTPGAGQTARELLDARLSATPFVACLDEIVRTPGATALLPSSAAALSDAEQVLDLPALPGLASCPPGDRPTAMWLQQLGASILPEADVIAVLREPAEADDARFYGDLVRWWDASAGRLAFEQALSAQSCVRVAGGHWRAPRDDVFFPRERGAELPDDLPVWITNLPDTPRVTMLLEAAGVRRFRWRELLVDFVLPRLTDADALPALREQGLGALRAYYEADPRGDQDVLSRLPDVLVPAATAHAGAAAFRPAGRTYFSAAWTGGRDLEDLYGGFAEPEFLATTPPDDVELRAKERAFLTWLGVADLPRLLTARAERREQWRTSALHAHPHRRAQPQAVESWLRHPDVSAASRCEQGHPESQQLTMSATLDRLPELLEAADVGTAKVLARLLATHWPRYRAGLTAEFTCTNSGHWGALPRPAPSVMAVLLSESAWVPCDADGAAALRPPHHVWRPGGELPAAAARHLPLLDLDLADRSMLPLWLDLGIVEAGAPRAADLADLLRRLAKDHAGQILARRSPPLELANWAMHRLDDAVARTGGDDVTHGGPLPLVARHRQGHLLAPDPYTCDDPLLTDTWVEDVPVLIDRDVAAFRARLGLRSLESAVDIAPVATGHLHDRAESLHHRLRQAAPFLAASALETGSERAADRLLPRLRNLELVACRQLTLEYVLGERSKARPEATTYIAERDSTRGRPRKIGTIYLELATHDAEPDWFSLGPQLAQFLGVQGQRDAFSLLLGADDATRRSFLRSRGVGDDAVDRWGAALHATLEPLDAGPAPGAPAVVNDDDSGTDDGRSAAPGDDEEQRATPEHDVPAPRVSDQGPADEPPPLQITTLAMEDGPLSPVTGPLLRTARPSSGTGVRVDWDRTATTNRRTGLRGEQWAYEQERMRVRELGFDPDVHVHWQSQLKEDSNYDIRSVDPDGHRLYIEVKATDSDDLRTPVEISSGELELAVQYRQRYVIYRVLETNTATPRLVRFDDPAGRILTGMAAIRISGAKLFLAPQEPGSSDAGP